MTLKMNLVNPEGFRAKTEFKFFDDWSSKLCISQCSVSCEIGPLQSCSTSGSSRLSGVARAGAMVPDQVAVLWLGKFFRTHIMCSCGPYLLFFDILLKTLDQSLVINSYPSILF